MLFVMATKPHRKLVKHYHEPGDLHELTFSCYLRLPLLTNDLWRSMFAEQLTTALQTPCFQLIAFVFMPEHVHLLVNPLEAEPSIDNPVKRNLCRRAMDCRWSSARKFLLPDWPGDAALPPLDDLPPSFWDGVRLQDHV
jgi:REP element-mobilizing transposase RayT